MSQLIEKEIKTALTIHQYTQLCHYFQLSPEACITQKNYYFDTPQPSLKALGIGLRLRLEQDTCEWTLKKRLDAFETLEITDTLSVTNARCHLANQTFPAGQVTAYLNTLHIDIASLRQIGYLKNERLEYRNANGLWVLDKSHFKSGISYELEFEYTENATAFYELLTQFNIPYTALPTKLARALS